MLPTEPPVAAPHPPISHLEPYSDALTTTHLHHHPQHQHQVLPHISRQALAAALVGISSAVNASSAAAADSQTAGAGLPPTQIVYEAATLPSDPFPAFHNPILPAPSADPWVFQHNHLWYSLQARERHLEVRVTHCLSQLAATEPAVIWRAPKGQRYSENLWAPEMHCLDGRWFIYLAADNGRNANHRIWVLEADAPLGPWKIRGQIETGGWAIDGTVLKERGQRYFIWSGWPGARNGKQNLYIAKMQNPWTLAGPRVLLTEPTYPWERRAMPLCEGPQILKHAGKTFIVYSASGSWTKHYCLGLLANNGGDPMNPLSWQKRGPVFQSTETVWGVGHCCFAQDAAAGDLIIYHAKTTKADGWQDRNVRAQPFRWAADGLPDFGHPVDI